MTKATKFSIPKGIYSHKPLSLHFAKTCVLLTAYRGRLLYHVRENARGPLALRDGERTRD